MGWNKRRKGAGALSLAVLLGASLEASPGETAEEAAGPAEGAGFVEKHEEATRLWKQGETAKAAAAFEAAARLGQKGGLRVDHVFLTAGNAYKKSGQVAKAREMYQACRDAPRASAANQAAATQALLELPAKPEIAEQPPPPPGEKKGGAKKKGGGGASQTAAPDEILPKGALPETEARPAMLPIPAGSFVMGSPESEPGRDTDEQAHSVTISRGFWMGRTEVTQRHYENIMGTNPSYFKGANRPVERVSWYDAVAYANKLSQAEGLPLCYQINGTAVTWPTGLRCRGYRLPTEAEWEYAARAGQATRYAGSDDPDRVAWHSGNAQETTHDVGGKAANAWGLRDISGNVWEWVWDQMGEYGQATREDPTGPTNGSYRVYRGGSWVSVSSGVRVAYRYRNPPGSADRYRGFRLSRSLP